MKKELIDAMEKYFGSDQKRIKHARKVLGYAEELVAEDGGDEEIIIAAAILHDIGIHAAKKNTALLPVSSRR